MAEKDQYQSPYLGPDIDAAIAAVDTIDSRVSTLERSKFTPTQPQLDAMNSGANTEKVGMIAVNTALISAVADRVSTLERTEFTPTTAQQNAMDSGIDSTKVAAIASNTSDISSVSGRVSALEQSEFVPTASQQTAMNSGIDSTKVAQITANQNAIAASNAGIAFVVDSGPKNILPISFLIKTKNGVTATVNADKSITLTGTSSSSSAFVLVYDTTDVSLSNSYSTKIPITPGTYVCKGTGDSRAKIQVWGYTDSADCEAYTNSKDDAEFTVTSKPFVSFRIYISASADFTTPLTIYPMCGLKTSLAISGAYVPAVLSHEELAKKVSDTSRYENPVDVYWTLGYVKPADGTIGADTDYSYSNAFFIRKGQRLVWNSTGPSSIAQLAKYDVSGRYVGNMVDVTENVKLRYLIPYKFWIADEDCYLRICHRITASGDSNIVSDAEVNPRIYNDIEFLSGSPLWGKKMVVVGDSLVHGSKIGEYPTWANWIGGKYRMTVVNEGINGSSIAELTQEIIDGNGGDDHDPIVNRYQDILRANTDADIIVYEGGANDRTQQVPIGQTTSTTKTEFCGAINRIINGSRIICPKAKIFFMSLPWRWTSAQASTGLTEADYASAMKAVCEAKSIPCRNPCFEGDIDFRDTYVAAWADEGLWPGVVTPPEEPTANRHYSPAGYQYIIPRMERFLNQ